MFAVLGPAHAQCNVIKQAEGSECCYVFTRTPNKRFVSKRAIGELKKGVSISALVVTVEESSRSYGLVTRPHFVACIPTEVSAGGALRGILVPVINSRILYFLPVSDH